MRESEGFVFAVSGAQYLPLTVGAAESLKKHHPDHPIDLYADVTCNSSVFDTVHELETSGFRPKFEALRRSRFARTIYLDGDTRCVAPISDVFEILGRFDIAAVHEVNRNAEWGRRMFRNPVPPAYPQVNGGMIGLRLSEKTREFIAHVEATLESSGFDRDQPVLRELLYNSDLRLAILPPEYNFIELIALEAMGQRSAAPRILHLTRLHKHLRKLRKRRELRTVEEVCGRRQARHINRLVSADRTLGYSGRARPLLRTGVIGILYVLVQELPARIRRILTRY